MKKIQILVILLFFFSLTITAQSKKLTINTSATCGMCKEKIESKLTATKGIKKAKLNLKKNQVKVVYNAAETNPTAIKNMISETGYDADDVKANKVAFEKLPKCCKASATKTCSKSGKKCSKSGKKCSKGGKKCSKSGKKCSKSGKKDCCKKETGCDKSSCCK